jgi:AcrR family transcriptional regulator
MQSTSAPARQPRATAHARVLETAYDLFSQHGVRAIGIDRIIAEAGVAKMTLYSHFHSKDDLVVASLDLREERWTHGWLEREIERRSDDPEARLLMIFDAFNDWFHSPRFEGCFLMNCLVEARGSDNPVARASVAKLAGVRAVVERLIDEAGLSDADALADELLMLMHGAIALAMAGDREAAQRARSVASLLIERARAVPA